LGAKQTSLIVIHGEWYRLFSPMFLHAGVIHYVLNMIALWFIGKAVEQCHGSMAAAILFIIPAVGGTILSALFLPEYISVGASGGIFGLIGACVADICR
jgi:membrane associated rhomboid family serine protease